MIKYGASIPIAFRAGNFAADNNTLLALKENGFLIDSSYNNCYLGNPCRIDNFEINDDNQAYLIKQPENDKEIEHCEKAIDVCPVEAISEV